MSLNTEEKNIFVFRFKSKIRKRTCSDHSQKRVVGLDSSFHFFKLHYFAIHL